jgi:hypothetical protein
MKGIILMVGLLAVCSMAFANPAIMYEDVVSEVWFNAEGHLMVEFAPFGGAIHLNSLAISHGDYREFIPDSTLISWESPLVVRDITALMPHMIFNPEDDSLVVLLSYYDQFYYADYLKWGNSFSNNSINPPLPGQSIAKYFEWRDSDWGLYLEKYITKDAPPTPGTLAYLPVARSVVKVRVIDLNSKPVPYVMCDNVYDDSLSFTDINGEFILVRHPGKYRLVLQHPITNETAFDQYYWLEPNDTLTVSIQIDMPAYPYDKIKGLHAYPMPFNFTQSDKITFRYYGQAEIKGDSYIKLYDIKGRYITKIPMGAKGFTDWVPPSGIVSGTYLAQMVSGNRILDTTTISIIK